MSKEEGYSFRFGDRSTTLAGLHNILEGLVRQTTRTVLAQGLEKPVRLSGTPGDYFTNLINQIVSLFPTIPLIFLSINTQYDVSDDKSRVEEIKRKSLEDKIL